MDKYKFKNYILAFNNNTIPDYIIDNKDLYLIAKENSISFNYNLSEFINKYKSNFNETNKVNKSNLSVLAYLWAYFKKDYTDDDIEILESLNIINKNSSLSTIKSIINNYFLYFNDYVAINRYYTINILKNYNLVSNYIPNKFDSKIHRYSFHIVFKFIGSLRDIFNNINNYYTIYTNKDEKIYKNINNKFILNINLSINKYKYILILYNNIYITIFKKINNIYILYYQIEYKKYKNLLSKESESNKINKSNLLDSFKPVEESKYKDNNLLSSNLDLDLDLDNKSSKPDFLERKENKVNFDNKTNLEKEESILENPSTGLKDSSDLKESNKRLKILLSQAY